MWSTKALASLLVLVFTLSHVLAQQDYYTTDNPRSRNRYGDQGILDKDRGWEDKKWDQDKSYQPGYGPLSPDNRGQFSPDNRNPFPPDNRGQFTPDNRGQFTPDNRNPFIPDRGLDSTSYPTSYPADSRERTDPVSGTNYRPGYNPSTESIIIREAHYFIVASRMIRPSQVYRVQVNVLRTRFPMVVRAAISRNGVEVSADYKEVKEGIPETLLMRVPPTSVEGEYKLRVQGNFNSLTGGRAFYNETKLTFSQRSMSIFIQMDKPVYMQGQTVKFRAIPINTALKAFTEPVDVYMLDPYRRIMRRWLSRQSNLGTVSLSYTLSDQPIFGEWIIQIQAQNQVEEKTFLVEEYYQTRFEVNVTMPAFFFDTDPYIYGIINANYTSGAPVHGNLTIKAKFAPIDPYRAGQSQYDIPEKYFDFDERLPSWVRELPWSLYTYRKPVLRFFNGTYRFKYPMRDLLQYVPNLDGMEVTLIATVGDPFMQEIIEGYSTARIYNSSIKVNFFGGTPQIFKPSMPFNLRVMASFHDGSALRASQLLNSRMEIRAEVDMRSGGRRTLETYRLNMTDDEIANWPLKMDLRHQLHLGDNNQRAQQLLNDITSMKVRADFTDGEGHRAYAELLLLTHESPEQKNIKIWSSTDKPKVGEYLVLHVQANFFIETFNWVIMSKGIILLNGQDSMQQSVTTFAVPINSEMAPVATAVVYYVGIYGDVVADSITFPVNGISRNNFTVYINNMKARTGENIEVAVYGEPGAYVGLSGIDRSFYTMQAGNELTYANVIAKMSYFGEQTNGTHDHSWIFHDGDPDVLVSFPSGTYGIDVNRTFEYVGLVVFTDAYIHRRPENCNRTQGYTECLSGRCFRLDKQCDGIMDCEDGTDEARCVHRNASDIIAFRKRRFNRVQRHYDNEWLWKDINIGPHGRFIFNIDVPRTPVHWMITVFGMSPTNGIGMLPKAVEYISVMPFYINVEMPTHCKQGEQIGIRVSVFNYQKNNIEAIVVLEGSDDYKFVHVEENGIVQSYSPRTSFGEHQFFVWIKAQDATVVYLPLVPTRLGEIEVRIYATTLIGRDSVVRKLMVEADGLPQYRHQSTLLDLSSQALVIRHMHMDVVNSPIITDSNDRYYVYGSNKATISVMGDVVGPIFPTMPINATSLIHLPMDCAEQNMFSFAVNFYTIDYMRRTNQQNVTQQRETFYHLNIGYQRQLSFMNSNGSFSLFRSDWNQSSPSVWLTAYCARVFKEASFPEWENYLYIDPEVISQAIDWVLQHQTEEGAFYEVTWLPDRKMNATAEYGYRHRNISLTAHVLITLETVKEISGRLSSKIAFGTTNAVRYLEKNINYLKEFGTPYEIAIVAYALMRAKASSADNVFNILRDRERKQDGMTYWGRVATPPLPTKNENQRPFRKARLPYEYDSENIETTAYAFLVYTEKKFPRLETVAQWLNSQRLTDGGWASTQDTAWAMKALMEYTISTRIRDVFDLRVTIEPSAQPNRSRTLFVNQKHLARLQSIEVPEATGTVHIEAVGTGYAILQMSVQYNVDTPKFQTEPPVRAFDLVARGRFHGRNQSHITYTSCQKWIHMEESPRSGMAVLDVSIPTGYIIQQQTLDHYIRSRQVRNLQRARFQPRKVLFYFDYLDEEEICVNFTIERWYPVANMSRYLAVRVYDYYAPERFNETIFDAVSTYILNICEVCGSSQCPYCPIYNLATQPAVPIVVILLCLYFSAARFFSPLVILGAG